MKQKTFVIRDEKVIENLVSFLQALPEKPVVEVVIRDHKKDRTAAQNSLMWLWITVISNEFGLTKEEQHKELKRRLLVPIYERDDQEYAAMINTIRKLYTDGYKEESLLLHDQIVKLTSTTKADVEQFAEYLTEIERDMIGKGIYLPHREDYEYAMMVNEMNTQY